MKRIKYFETYKINDLKDMLFKMTEKNKNKLAFRVKVKDKIVNKTFEDFKNDVQCLGTALIEKGLQNKRIAIIGKNSYEWATSYLASTIIGIVVPIDKECQKDTIIEFLNTGEVDALIADTKYLDILSKNLEKLVKRDMIFIDMNNTKKYLKFSELIENGQELLKSGDQTFENVKINPNEMKVLLFTSGTTGNSKGVMLSHKNICSNIISIASIVKVDNSTSVLSILPLFKIYK